MSVVKGKVPWPAMGKCSKEEMLEALTLHNGLVIRAIKWLRKTKKYTISAVGHYRWMKEDPEYKQQVEELIELKRDFVEEHLTQLIKANDSSCVIFAGKCLLPKRGYQEKTVIAGDPDAPLGITIPAGAVKAALDEIYKKAEG
jgi:hypothetical protein